VCVSPSGIGLFFVVVFILLLSSCRSHLPPSVPLLQSRDHHHHHHDLSLSLLCSHRHQNNVQIIIIIINNENVIALGSVARSIVGSRCGDPHERHCLLCCWRWCCASGIARTRYSLPSLSQSQPHHGKDVSGICCDLALWILPQRCVRQTDVSLAHSNPSHQHTQMLLLLLHRCLNLKVRSSPSWQVPICAHKRD